MVVLMATMGQFSRMDKQDQVKLSRSRVVLSATQTEELYHERSRISLVAFAK